MVKVITYGTYDMLHFGHIRLLERAKALGDYLIVGVTADDFDKTRGKINIKQSLMERINAIKETGLADEIIVEEYEGQKIDDIKKYDIDIFTVGSDWEGKFDYLNEFCKVVYLPRTEGVSSTEIRAVESELKLGLVGSSSVLNKVYNEAQYVNGLEICGIFADDKSVFSDEIIKNVPFTNSFDELVNKVDAVYILSHPSEHYENIKYALCNGKHVICESPIVLYEDQYDELVELAKENNCVLFDAIKTAYSTAYNRMLVLAKSGKIGDIISIDTTCTSLIEKIEKDKEYSKHVWNSICAWGPTAMLPIYQLLGINYREKEIITKFADEKKYLDEFTKISFLYDNAVATIKVGKGVKSEGILVITGTKGYIYIPAPWWKTDYFEVRYENSGDNRRYYYQLDGEGIRYELVAFVKAIKDKKAFNNVDSNISREIISTISDFYNNKVKMI